MATITKRQWPSKSGPKSAWVLAFTDREGKRHKRQFAKKRDAEAEQTRVTAEISKGSWRAEAERKTVKDAVDGYLNSMEREAGSEHVGVSYYRDTKAQLHNHILPKLGNVTLADLTKGRVIEMRDDLQQKGIGATTINRSIGSLSRALVYAGDRDWINGNPAAGVTVKVRRDDGDRRVHAPSRAVLTRILKVADAETAARIRFAIATGLRASEQWALRWSDIDMNRKTLSVQRRVGRLGDVRDRTKSEAGRRTVPLSDTMIAMMKARAGQGDAYVFPDSSGGFTRHSNFAKREWNPLLEKAEVDHFGWHALRHFAVSSWVATGMNLKAVQVIAGHSTFQVTVDRYAHLLPEDVPHETFNAIAETLP